MARLRQQVTTTGHTILVVDDHPAILETLSRLLTQEGHQVVTAASGEEAIQLCRTHPIHLMLLDYFMPDLTGEEVVRQIRSFAPSLQIVLQTGYASEKPARQMLKELDIQGYHDKSEGPEKLLIWVDAALKAYHHVQALRASRNGLRYILTVTPEIQRLQPLEDLMRGALVQIQGLLGSSGAFVATVDVPLHDSFVALLEQQQFQLRVSTGRFSALTWQTLAPSEQAAVRAAAATSRVQLGPVIAVPLVAGVRTLGVVFVDRPLNASDEGDLLELFANQVAVAIENVRLYELATVDDLTRLINRRHWLVRLDDTLRLGHRYEHPTSVLLLDLDHFKRLNDTYGHLAGDHALATFGRWLHRQIRETDLAGRYGGEEFAILLPQTDCAGAVVVAERLCATARQLQIPWESTSLTVQISIGVATLQPEPHTHGRVADIEVTRTALLQDADAALYAAKSQGRDRVAVGSSSVEARMAMMHPLTAENL